MKIWFAASIPESSSGGVNRSITTLSGGLEKGGHKIRILYARTPREYNYLLFSLKLALRLLIRFWDRPDWIIARSTDGVFCALLVHLLKMRKTRVAIHNHGWEEKAHQIERRLPASIISNPTTWKARYIRFPLLRVALRFSAKCISGTIEETRWISKEYPLLRTKLCIVPNGIEQKDSPFWPAQEEYPPSFLIVGGFTWKKNIEYGLELFRHILGEIPDARLFLVGTGKIPPERELQIQKLGDSVFIVEQESPQKMIRWYETCPYLIATSRYEGGRSFAILEAQSRGVIVFASNIPSTREIITDSKNGYLLSGVQVKTDFQKIIHTVRQETDRLKTVSIAAWSKASRNRLDRQVKKLITTLK